MNGPDDWEMSEPEGLPPPPPPPPAAPKASSGFSFNPKATSFNFSPGASAFVPGGAATASAPPVAPAAAPPAEQARPQHVVVPVAAVEARGPADGAPPACGEPSPTKTGAGAAGAGPATDGAALAAKELKALSMAEKKAERERQADEAAAAAAAPVDVSLADEGDMRDHMNCVFIGHVDAGKSTIGGQILYLTGSVDERLIQKYENEAKQNNRESWYMAYIMDTDEKERAKGKTVEVGRAYFETPVRRYTVLDAPGHKNYVPNMIQGATQADVGVLVISARKGEFETGFEKGGQTREHAQLAKVLGVQKLVVVVNKMDDPSVAWAKERYDEIETKLTPFLKACGYNLKKDVVYLPISGLLGTNIKDRVKPELCSWYTGPCLFEVMDALEMLERDPAAPFRMPVSDKYKDMGTMVMGKSEQGFVRRDDTLLLMPNKQKVKVLALYRDETECQAARAGENIRMKLSGIEEEDAQPGFVLCSLARPIPCVMTFDAQLQILELPEHKSIFTAGYKCVMHIHTAVEEVEALDIISQVDPKTRQPMKKKAMFLKNGAIAVVKMAVEKPLCIELFASTPQLGRFTLRDEGKTIAIGKVVALDGA